MLGRGLESLIPKRWAQEAQTSQSQPQPQKSSEEEPVISVKDAVFLIEVDKIKPNPYQPRREFDKAALRELADSIRQHGILQPLVVTKVIQEVPSGEKVEYQLIAGERRLRAAKLAGFSRVPTIIREAPPRSKLELSLIENVQREDLNSMEKAFAFRQLVDQFGLKHHEIARRIGKSREVVSNTLRLLTLPAKIQRALLGGEINENHARAILFLRDPKQQEALLAEIISGGWPAREAEKRARGILLSGSGGTPSSKFSSLRSKLVGPKVPPREISPHIQELEYRVRKALNIQTVSIQPMKTRQFKVVIKFDSRKELIALFDRVKIIDQE